MHFCHVQGNAKSLNETLDLLDPESMFNLCVAPNGPL